MFPGAHSVLIHGLFLLAATQAEFALDGEAEKRSLSSYIAATAFEIRRAREKTYRLIERSGPWPELISNRGFHASPAP